MDTLKNIIKNFNTFNALSKSSLQKFDSNFLITFEGIEGCGKTTQVKKIKSYLEEKGFSVHLLREPGGTTFGEKLREAILSQKNKLSTLAEAHLFASARAELLEEKILKFLDTPKNIIILDRYLDSSILYQGIAGGLGIETILEIHKHFPLNTFPDLTLYLDISVETSLKRMAMRGEEADYFEGQKEALLEKLSHGGKKLCQIFPTRIKNIDGEKSEEAVFELIRKEVDKLWISSKMS